MGNIIFSDAADHVDLVVHMNRKVESLDVPVKFWADIFSDMGKCIEREFGLDWEHRLQKRHLYIAHEVIDGYQLPTVILEAIEAKEEEQEGNGEE